MSYQIVFGVLELFCSRICHDLISPVTVINNGMELLEDDPGDMLENIRDLLMNSASEGAGKLQYFRLAYGLGGNPDGDIDGILALQEVDEDGRGRNPHVERGEEMLDRLDEIRAGLLTGKINSHSLEQLLAQVRSRSQDFTDPKLREILAEIELRAAEELAKPGQAA